MAAAVVSSTSSLSSMPSSTMVWWMSISRPIRPLRPRRDADASQGVKWVQSSKEPSKASDYTLIEAQKVGAWSCFEMEWAFLYLLLLGLLSGLISAAIDYTIEFFQYYHRAFTALAGGDLFFGWFLWTVFLMAFALGVVAFTVNFEPHAAGSGVPEIKTILSGIALEDYLHWRNLVAKVIGMAIAAGSGTIIGKPLSHAGAVLASVLLKIPLFHRMNSNALMRQQMLATGAACGVSGNFGSPVGGVLFSIEVTSTYYPVRNYMFAYVACVIASISFLVARQRPAFLQTGFAMDDWSLPELPFFVLIGFIGGMCGTLYTKLNHGWFLGRKALSYWFPLILNPYVYTAIVSFVTACVTYGGFFGTFNSVGMYRAMKDMLTLGQLEGLWQAGAGVFYTLAIFLISRTALASISITLPLPGGSFVPLICTGSVLGRLIGELTRLVFPSGIGTGGVPLNPGVCATVGAAAMLTGSTHCLSSAVIVFELTGQLNLLSPLLVGTITAYYIAKPLSLNIWDQITVRKGLPFLPDITPTVASYLKRVSQFTNRDIYCLPKETTREEAAKLLKDCPRDTIPVVDTLENLHLVGTARRAELEAWINSDATANGARLTLPYGNAPVQLTQDMRMTTAHLLFIGLLLQVACVTEDGKLIGTVSREDLCKAVSDV